MPAPVLAQEQAQEQAQASIAAAAVVVAALMSGLARSAEEAAALQFTLVPLAGAVRRVAVVVVVRVAAAVPRVVAAVADGGNDRLISSPTNA
jgi:hypothetical protein